MTDAMPTNEVSALATDDAEQFYDAVEPFVEKMGRVAARFGGLENREDIVQQALLQAWRSRRQYRPERGTISTWLIAITAHEATRLSRRLRSGSRLSVADQPEPYESVELRAAMRQLTGRERTAIECFYLLGLSVAETATAMKCSEGTVKSTLARGRERLRGFLR